jgi:hypothetical protein
MMAVLAGCPTEDDSSSGGGGKPTTLASDASASQDNIGRNHRLFWNASRDKNAGTDNEQPVVCLFQHLEYLWFIHYNNDKWVDCANTLTVVAAGATAVTCTGRSVSGGTVNRQPPAATTKSLFKMWIFTVNRPKKSRFSALFGSLQGRILAFATPKFKILNRL